jgi:hypothetical protein
MKKYLDMHIYEDIDYRVHVGILVSILNKRAIPVILCIEEREEVPDVVVVVDLPEWLVGGKTIGMKGREYQKIGVISGYKELEKVLELIKEKEGILEADLYYNVSFGRTAFAVKCVPYFNEDIPF